MIDEYNYNDIYAIRIALQKQLQTILQGTAKKTYLQAKYFYF